jgi:hypothetical protein
MAQLMMTFIFYADVDTTVFPIPTKFVYFYCIIINA